MTALQVISLLIAISAGSTAWGKGPASDKFAQKGDKLKRQSSGDETADGAAVDDASGDKPSTRDDDGPAPTEEDPPPADSDDRSERRREPNAGGQRETPPSSATSGGASSSSTKRDPTGSNQGSVASGSESGRDRFFRKKPDTPGSENGTITQGSLTSSSLAYRESGGSYAPARAATESPGNNAATYGRYYTDLRLQTNFRHIGGGRWDARIDARVRLVNSPSNVVNPDPEVTPDPTKVPPAKHIQSGLRGENEYEVRELWLTYNGQRTDVTLGRQVVLDLAAVKIDGLRFDYETSKKLTLVGFAGLYPLRGSRSITTDYIELKNPADPAESVGSFVGSGGFGAAYRTPTGYGAFGAVAMVPLEAEQPRVFVTANGYFRPTPTLDVYHLALIDLVSAYGAQITNLSAGLNYKPSAQLRFTAALHHVDTDALNVQAAAFYDARQPFAAVQNEFELRRLSTTTARSSISVGLGHLQRFEITAAAAFRYRPSFDLTRFTQGGTRTAVPIDAAKSVDVYGSVMDRRSLFDLRIGLDAMRTYRVGTVAFQRGEVVSARGFFGRSLRSGLGEWEVEASYTDSKDSGITEECGNGKPPTCFGQSTARLLAAGGAVHYRLASDWFGVAQAYLSRTVVKSGAAAPDPPITGLTGYLRIAYRF